MFYLATECLISFLYSEMYNFNFISYCKGIYSSISVTFV